METIPIIAFDYSCKRIKSIKNNTIDVFFIETCYGLLHVFK